MNNSRSGIILFIQIIFSIGAVAFLARLALISTGSWLWLIEIFAALLVLGFIGFYVNIGVNRGVRALRHTIRPGASSVEEESALDIVRILMENGIPEQDALNLVRKYAEEEFRRQK